MNRLSVSTLAQVRPRTVLAPQFGRQSFTVDTINRLALTDTKAPILSAFRQRLDKGSKVLAADSFQSAVQVYTVKKNDGHRIELGGTQVQPLTLSLPKDGELYKTLLHMNLPMINGEMTDAKALWRQQFETLVNQVETKSPVRKTWEYVRPDRLAHAIGFALNGELLMLRNPHFELVSNADPLPPVTGEGTELARFIRAVQNPDEVDQMEWTSKPDPYGHLQKTRLDKMQKRPTTDHPKSGLFALLQSRLAFISPRNLLPINNEGLNERSIFEIQPLVKPAEASKVVQGDNPFTGSPDEVKAAQDALKKFHKM